jgi:hypothetical protein
MRCEAVRLMISAANKPAEADLLWEKNIVLCLISSSEQGKICAFWIEHVFATLSNRTKTLKIAQEFTYLLWLLCIQNRTNIFQTEVAVVQYPVFCLERQHLLYLWLTWVKPAGVGRTPSQLSRRDRARQAFNTERHNLYKGLVHFPCQSKIFPLSPIISNLSTHAWSIKCR